MGRPAAFVKGKQRVGARVSDREARKVEREQLSRLIDTHLIIAVEAADDKRVLCEVGLLRYSARLMQI